MHITLNLHDLNDLSIVSAPAYTILLWFHHRQPHQTVSPHDVPVLACLHQVSSFLIPSPARSLWSSDLLVSRARLSPIASFTCQPAISQTTFFSYCLLLSTGHLHFVVHQTPCSDTSFIDRDNGETCPRMYYPLLLELSEVCSQGPANCINWNFRAAARSLDSLIQIGIVSGWH